MYSLLTKKIKTQEIIYTTDEPLKKIQRVTKAKVLSRITIDEGNLNDPTIDRLTKVNIARRPSRAEIIGAHDINTK